MNIERPSIQSSSVLTSSASPSAILAAGGYSYNAFHQGQNLEMRSTAGDPSDPWLRTVNRTVAGVGIGLSTSLLIMRVYTKARIMRKFWWDDTFIILAWLLSMTCQAIMLYGYSYSGYGVHVWSLSPSALRIYPKTMLASTVVYVPCLACAKLAILMFYYALLNVIDFWKNVIYVVGSIIVAYSIAILLAVIFACHPIQKNWDSPEMKGWCISRPALYLALATSNTVTDIMLILIPIPTIWRLHVRAVQKLGIAAIFGIGCLTIITSIVRLATIWQLSTSADQPYEIALAALLVHIEANFIIICGCLPYLRQFLRHHAPNWVGHGSNASSSESGYQSKGNLCRRIRLHAHASASTPPQVSEGPFSTDEVAQGVSLNEV